MYEEIRLLAQVHKNFLIVLQVNHYTQGIIRYMIIYYNRCDCLRWAGVGEVGGSWSWYNGPVSLQIVAHELGHNNRALHSNFLNWELWQSIFLLWVLVLKTTLLQLVNLL